MNTLADAWFFHSGQNISAVVLGGNRFGGEIRISESSFKDEAWARRDAARYNNPRAALSCRPGIHFETIQIVEGRTFTRGLSTDSRQAAAQQEPQYARSQEQACRWLGDGGQRQVGNRGGVIGCSIHGKTEHHISIVTNVTEPAYFTRGGASHGNRPDRRSIGTPSASR